MQPLCWIKCIPALFSWCTAELNEISKQNAESQISGEAALPNFFKLLLISRVKCHLQRMQYLFNINSIQCNTVFNSDCKVEAPTKKYNLKQQEQKQKVYSQIGKTACKIKEMH